MHNNSVRSPSDSTPSIKRALESLKHIRRGVHQAGINQDFLRQPVEEEELNDPVDDVLAKDTRFEVLIIKNCPNRGASQNV